MAGSEAEILVRSFLPAHVAWSDALHQMELAVQQVLTSSAEEDRLSLVESIDRVERLRGAVASLAEGIPAAEKIAAFEECGIASFDARRIVFGGAFAGAAGLSSKLLIDWEDAEIQLGDILAVIEPLVRGTDWDPGLKPYFAQRTILAFGALRATVGAYIGGASALSRTMHTGVLWFEAACAAAMFALIAWRFGKWLDRAERARAALEAEYDKNALTLDLIADAVVTAAPDGRIVYRNARAEHLFAAAEARIEKLSDLDTLLFKEDGSPFAVSAAASAEAPLQRPVHDLVFRVGGSSPLYVTITSAVSRGLDGQGQIVVAMRNRQREREMQRELEELAYRDPLTSLPNRRLLMTEMEQVLESPQAADNPARAVFLLENLDHFRMVNDGRGHAAGDSLLLAVAETLRAVLPAEATVARLAGDEFGVLVPGSDQAYGTQLAKRIVSEVSATSIDWEGSRIGCTCSVGLTEIPAVPLGGAIEVLRQADVACALAKDSGRAGYQVYRPDDPETVSRGAEIDRVMRLRDALERDRFALYVQEIRSLSPEAEARHYEVLVRMVDGSGKIVPPSEFIPIAERTGLVRAIDRWVVKAAIRKLTDELRGLRPIPKGTVFGVNLSGETVVDVGFCGELLEWMEVSGIDPSLLCFEITESAVVRNLDLAAQTLRRIQEFGSSLAIDDFGVGQASFGYLRDFPSDYLKIDGSFVRRMSSARHDQAMVRAMNEVAHILGKLTIAEFVEDEETLSLLRTMGVDYVQGYAIGKPKPFEWGACRRSSHACSTDLERGGALRRDRRALRS